MYFRTYQSENKLIVLYSTVKSGSNGSKRVFYLYLILKWFLTLSTEVWDKIFDNQILYQINTTLAKSIAPLLKQTDLMYKKWQLYYMTIIWQNVLYKILNFKYDFYSSG